jgi:transcriptional regulator GlxA family with amidase domain
LIAHASFEEALDADTLLISGGIGYADAAQDERLLAVLRDAAGRGIRLGSICTGSLILAAAGLLGGRRATTHWAYAEELRRRAPGCEVEEDAIYVRSADIYSSAGVSAGMDLALALVEQDWSRDVSLAVAQQLVLYLKRPGGQSQFSRMLEAQRNDDSFGALQRWIEDHVAGDLSIAAMADHMAMSVRQFSRAFRDRVHDTPARYVERIRVERARRSISEGRSPLKLVARECGFHNEQALRRAFHRQMGIAPVDYRQRFA